jgi:hypothetical protein
LRDLKPKNKNLVFIISSDKCLNGVVRILGKVDKYVLVKYWGCPKSEERYISESKFSLFLRSIRVFNNNILNNIKDIMVKKLASPLVYNLNNQTCQSILFMEIKTTEISVKQTATIESSSLKQVDPENGPKTDQSNVLENSTDESIDTDQSSNFD